MCIKFSLLFLAISISSCQIRSVRSQDNCKTTKNITNPLQELKNCLFKGYNPKAIPLQKDEKSIYVDVSLSLQDLFFSDMTGEAELTILMEMNWTDPLLKWNPGDFGNISLVILTQPDAGKIWNPSFSSAYTYRFGGRKNTDDLFRVSKLEVNSQGKVMFSDFVSMNSMCDGDLTDFPFDKYECGSLIMSDNFENEVIFQFVDEQGGHKNETSLTMTSYTKTHLDITRTKILLDVSKRFSPEPNKEMVVTLIYLLIDISRNTGTHILVFHVPAIGFCLLLLLPLWIAADSLTRYIYPLVVAFGSIFQINAIGSHMRMPAAHFNHPTHLVSFYRDLMLLSMMVLMESMVSSLLWKRKPLLESLRPAYCQVSSLPFVEDLIQHTLFETPIPEPIQGQKQEDVPDDYRGPTLLSLAKLMDRLVFCGLSLLLVILYWKLVP